MKGVILGTILSVAATAAIAAAAPDLPDPSRTPGATNPDVTQDNIESNICKANWTATVRPNSAHTTALKKQQLADWGYTDRKPAHYEEDHLISLQLGGAPDDDANLWPEHYSGKWGAKIKDTLEGELKRRICTKPTDPDHITLKEGQDAISGDWKAAYAQYVCTRHHPPLTKIIRAHCNADGATG
jgi:hypothetical protein